MASVLLLRDSEPGPETGVCAIVVLYDDNSSRDAAIRLCNSLEKAFHSELDFHITWCRFKYFKDPAVASEAAELAADANLLLVAIQCADDLPLEVKAWFERWLPNRELSDGALVLLNTSGLPSPPPTIPHTSYLYLLAQRGNLDYISLSSTTTSLSADGLSESKDSPKGFPIPMRWEGDVSGRSQHYSRSGINE